MVSYQQVNRFDNIQKDFILAIFDALRSPRNCICNRRWWSWSSFKFLPFLGDVPV